MLALDRLCAGYPGTRGVVIAEANAVVERGGFICVLGRNGAGKSTLMRTIAGLLSALGGSATLSGKSVAALPANERAKHVAVVLTERVTSPGLTVADVVALGRQPYTDWRGRLADDDRERVTQALEQTGASEFALRYLDDLSDGERQRVMIARALAQDAQLLVLDEITAFLDLPGRVEVMALLREHARATGAIVLLSSHDLDLSLQFADTLWLVDGGRLAAGPADQLIGDGSIARAFDSGVVRFSHESRRFQIQPVQPCDGEIQ